MTDQKPNPGTMTALLRGCTCSTKANEYGLGIHGDGEKHGWAVNEDCPVHGSGSEVKP